MLQRDDEATEHRDPYAARPAAPRRARLAWILAPIAALVAAGGGAVAALTLAPPSLLPPATTSTEVVTPSPDVVVAIKSLARLETTTYHVERVVDLADDETRAWGLVRAKDSILLVAVGDVVAGVDLSKVEARDVDADWETRSVTVTLPPAEIFSARLDDTATHVFARHTDVLAARHEDLEGRARKEAERSMEKTALDQGVKDKAQASAEAAVRALLESAGFQQVDVKVGASGR